MEHGDDRDTNLSPRNNPKEPGKKIRETGNRKKD